jgi:hypothetical protein
MRLWLPTATVLGRLGGRVGFQKVNLRIAAR